MNYGAVKGSLAILSRRDRAVSLREMAISEEDYMTLKGDVVWLPNDRIRMRGALDAVLHYTTDQMGLPRVDYPAEFVATALAVFVHPVNLATACSWLSGLLCLTSDQARQRDEPPQGMEKCSAAQLFSLCTIILGDQDLNQVRMEFENKFAQPVGATGQTTGGTSG